MTLTDLIPVLLPVAMTLGSIAVAVLKHGQHATLSALLEEALVIERAREGGAPTLDLLTQAAQSDAAKVALQAVVTRVEARLATPTPPSA
jgi:hypothetical protein